MTRPTTFTGSTDGVTAQYDIYTKDKYVVLDYSDGQGIEVTGYFSKKSAFDLAKAIIDAAKTLPRV